MIKHICSAAVLLVLTGCTPEVVDEGVDLGKLHKELEGCRHYRYQTESGNNIQIVRCPAAQTQSLSYPAGKATHYSVTIEPNVVRRK